MHNLHVAPRRLFVALLATFVLTATVPAVASEGPPSTPIVTALLRGNSTALTFNAVTIGAGRRATAKEAAYLQCDLGQTIYPVYASYTSHNGMYVRDTAGHWYAFRSRIKHGDWDLSSWWLPGDKSNVLRP